jgi:Ca-activated chloride channel family protein
LKSADWTRSVDLAQRGAAPGIARLWAARKIEELQYQMGRSQTEEQLQPQIVELAIAHHLVTRYTSLVAVDKTPVRGAAQALNGIDVGDADRIAFARGATAAPTLALVGIAGLLLLAFGLRLPIATAAGARR